MKPNTSCAAAAAERRSKEKWKWRVSEIRMNTYPKLNLFVSNIEILQIVVKKIICGIYLFLLKSWRLESSRQIKNPCKQTFLLRWPHLKKWLYPKSNQTCSMRKCFANFSTSGEAAWGSTPVSGTDDSSYCCLCAFHCWWRQHHLWTNSGRLFHRTFKSHT